MADKSQVNLKRKHHEKQAFCYSRPRYREARWERAVKVYTINLESKYLLVQGVPSVGVTTELLELFALYGAVEEYQVLDDYPAEEFTKVYWIKFQKIIAARIAKKKLDNKSFFGGVLHVCYAPEYEKVEDTREKLEERRKVVARKCKEYYGNQSEKQMASVETSDDNKQNRISQTQETKEPIRGKEQHVVSATQQQSQTQDATNSTDGSCQLYSTSRVSTNQSDYGSHGYNYGFPQLPPPPVQLHPIYFPQPPHPPWDLPHVPTAHATLPLHLQNLPPPPPLTAPSTMSPVATATPETTMSLERTTGKETCTETSTVLSSDGDRAFVLSSLQRTPSVRPEKPFLEVKSNTSWKEDHVNTDTHISSIPLQLNTVQDQVLNPVVIPPSITGSVSLDMTVQSVRHKMRQISGTAAEIRPGTDKITSQKTEERSTATSAAKKKRKRI